jgi:site-specific DNA recombinase
MTSPALRAAIYTRISKSDPTVEATADQERRCRELAEREGYEVVAVFTDDGVSAYSGKKRPDWARLASGIERGSFDLILAVAEDRFARNAAEKIGLQVACAKRSVRWHTLGGGLVDPATAGGALMSTITAGIAQYESQIKSERVAASVVRRRLEGSDVGGPRPFGFSIDRRSLVEPEAALVREAHALLLGSGTMYAVVKLFIESGVQTVRGGAWSYPVAAKIMRRPRNAALAVTEDGTTYPLTQHPSIVSREDHEAAVALLSTGKKTGRRPAHLASGNVARCGSCGAPTRYSGQKGIYRCVAGNNGLRLADGLVHASAKVEEVDRQIVAEVVPALMARMARGDANDSGAATRLLVAQRAELAR